MRPVKRIEVSLRNTKLRAILAAACLLVALVSIGYGVSLLVNKTEGWRQVEVSSSRINSGAELVFNYRFGESALSVNQEYREVSRLYTQGCEEGYDLFDRQGQLSKLTPNTPVEVDKALYDALLLVHKAGNRGIYLAPVYDEYQRMFLCENEEEAARYDPLQNAELAQQLSEMAAYCNDPAMISMAFVDGEVTLKVAEEYLQYAEEMGITEFLDFGWMKNAFVVDHIADLLLQEGYTHGYIASYDGFTRNLDSGRYELNLFHRQGTDVLKPGVMEYQSPAALVQLRDFPMAEQDRWHYYAFSDGHIASVYADPADGLTKCAAAQLVAYGQDLTCAEILMDIAPVYLQQELQTEALAALTQQGVYSLWCENSKICYNQQGLNVRSADTAYTPRFVEP